MSRQSWPRQGEILSRQNSLCRDRVGKGREIPIVTECYYVATEFAKSRRNYVATEQFYVAIELARVGRISFATEDFYVTTELATTKSSIAHDRVGRTKAGAHDIMALCCVAIEEAMCARQSRPGGHDQPWAHTTGLRRAQQRCVRERGILSRQNS